MVSSLKGGKTRRIMVDVASGSYPKDAISADVTDCSSVLYFDDLNE